jgi:ABC-type spermidine/putrescine transport system permease subunit I
MLAPPLAWLALFFLVPMIAVFAYGLATRTPGGGVVLGFSVENFARIGESELYIRGTLRSLRIGVVVTAVTLLVAYPVAYYLALVAARWRLVLFVLLIVPWWCSILVKSFAWVAILAEKGVLNRALLQMGLIDHPLRLLYNEVAVVIGLVHVLVPFMVLPIYATLEKLDRRLMEAAANLGSSPLRVFLEVVLPLSLPGVAAGSLLTFILGFGSASSPSAILPYVGIGTWLETNPCLVLSGSAFSSVYCPQASPWCWEPWPASGWCVDRCAARRSSRRCSTLRS